MKAYPQADKNLAIKKLPTIIYYTRWTIHQALKLSSFPRKSP
jgi:hypothetical protein